MNEIVKHINDTNASYRSLGAGDAKNTDLFLDNEHYQLFEGLGEQITVRFNKENLQQAILFIASILPRKFDNSAVHKKIPFSSHFVLDQLALLDAFFTVDGKVMQTKTQIWNARKDVPKKNGEIDNRFYFNGLFEDVTYTRYDGTQHNAKFTIRNYLAGGYSDLHIQKNDDKIFDVWITNTTEAYEDGKETKALEVLETSGNDYTLQQIFYGAPGTGKSHKIKKYFKEYEVSEDNIFRTTFHPDSDYSTFVGAYKPKPVETGEYYPNRERKKAIEYDFVPQAFIKAYMRAYEKPDENVFLVIEEINRGNCAQIFGDLFQLLDRDEQGKSEYPIKADNDLAEFLKKKCGEESDAIRGDELRLPSNLYIWATMNTSDQSLFPIDSAFKRRWDWEYMPINTKIDTWSIRVKGVDYDWSDFLEIVNKRIFKATSSEDKQLGFFFCKSKDKVITADRFVNKVLFYLWNDVFKDYSEGESIFKAAEGEELSFSMFYSPFGKIDEDNVAELLKRLGVKTNGTSDEQEEDEDGNSLTSSTKDYSKFSVNGKGSWGKNRLATECVKEYVRLNPDVSAEHVLNEWNSLGMTVPHFIESKEFYDSRTDNSKRSYEVQCGEGTVFVAHNGYGSNGLADILIEKVNAKDWGIKIEKLSA